MTIGLAAGTTALFVAYAIWILSRGYDVQVEEYAATAVMLVLCLAGCVLGLRVVLQRDAHPRLRVG